MLSWKLLGDLLPGELRLECERAGVKASDKDSHNYVKLSKYILGNGYDPENFFFNTIYQTDKNNPLVGMVSGRVTNQLPSNTRVTAPTVLSAARASPSTTSTQGDSGFERGSSQPGVVLGNDSKSLFTLFTKMSQDIQKLVTIMEDKKCVTGSGLGVDRAGKGSPTPDLPSWDSFESDSSMSDTFSEDSSSSDFWDRSYDRNLLIKDRICLAYQHGNCIYPDQGIKHENARGQNVLHYCGLCWTDSPENQCFFPGNECPGPDHNM